MSATTTTTLLSVGLPLAFGLFTLVASNRHARNLAKDTQAANQRAESKRLVFQAREARYEDRRDAVIALVTACDDEAQRIQEHENDPRHGGSPGDIHWDYPFTKLNGAHARLSLLAEADVAEAGERLRDAVVGWFHGQKGGWDAYTTQMAKFQIAARAMLAADRDG